MPSELDGASTLTLYRRGIELLEEEDFEEAATPLEEAARRAVAATRQLARRQLTWLRAEPGAEWFDSEDPAASERIAARVAEWLRMPG